MPRLPNGLSALVAVLARSIASLWCITAVVWALFPRMTAVEHVTGGHTGPTNLPWTFEETGANNRLEVTLPVRWVTPTRWNVRPDNTLTALRVNGSEVPLSRAEPQAGLSDWQHGFDIDLGPWLHPGENHLEMIVDNSGGPGGITLRPRMGWRPLLLAAGLMPWLWTLARMLRIRRIETRILGAALVVLSWYWAATPWFERYYDVKRCGEGGHLDYVIYVAQHHVLPPPNEGWQFYQPPAYYEGGALAWRWAEWLGVSGPEMLQAYAVALWLVFLTASAAAIELTLRRPRWARAIATAAVALWPSGVLAGPRIGNDLSLYAVAGVGTYFMIRWWRGQERRHLAGMALSVAASLSCKGTGVALLAAALALLGLRLLRRGGWRALRPSLEAMATAATMVAGALLGVARNVSYWRQGKLSSWLVSNVGSLDPDLRVPNDLRAYVPFDVPTFLAEPWMSSRDDASGRRNFWNYFLRSSLSGEFRFEGKLHEAIALVWGGLLLGLVLVLVAGLIARRPTLSALWRDAPLYALGGAWVSSLVMARILYPFSCQSDFRYVVPVVVPFVIACARGRWLGLGLLSVMAASSALFFVTL
jgi:hypothetical protein